MLAPFMDRVNFLGSGWERLHALFDGSGGGSCLTFGCVQYKIFTLIKWWSGCFPDTACFMLPKVDELGLKILFLLIPGIIALGIIKSLGPKRPRSDFESGLQIFIYGIACYAIAGFLEGLYLWIFLPPPGKGFWEIVGESSLGLATLNPDAGLSAGQIAFATGIALAVGCFVANIQSHSVPHRVLRAVGLTKRTSEVDIWELTLNSPDLDSWVTVRHHENGKVYQGWVRGYSDGGDERELLLAEVTVYATSAQNDGTLVEVDQVPVLYLGLDRKNTVVELRNIPGEREDSNG